MKTFKVGDTVRWHSCIFGEWDSVFPDSRPKDRGKITKVLRGGTYVVNWKRKFKTSNNLLSHDWLTLVKPETKKQHAKKQRIRTDRPRR